MADQTQFKHIKVNAAEDDVVIYAGTHAHVQDSDEAAAVAAESIANASKPKASQDLQPEKTDDYHETTLEDIKTSKMPTMQKVIIAIAVVAIAAFAVWYMFFQ